MAVSKVILNGETLIDVTQKTVTPSNMLSGITALKNDGTDIVGSYTPSSFIVDSLTVTPTESSQIFEGGVVKGNLTDNISFFSTTTKSITTKSIGSTSYIIAKYYGNDGFLLRYTYEGYFTFSSSSQNIDPYGYLSATNTSVTLNETSFDYVTVGIYNTTQIDGYKPVTVQAIPSDYVGSAIPTRSSADLSASGSVVTAPSGWYGAAVSKAVVSGTLNGFISVPSILPTWSLNSSTGIINAYYETALGIQPIASSGYFETGEYIYPTVTMDSSYTLPTQAAATIVPSESVQTAVQSGKFTIGDVTVAAISSDYVGSGVTHRSSADLTASLSIINVPSGYYEVAASSAIASASLKDSDSIPFMPNFSVNSAGIVIAMQGVGSQIMPIAKGGYATTNDKIFVSCSGSSSYQLSTAAGTTIIPTTSSQTAVASGKYTTGIITIAGDSALVAENIITGASIFGVIGTAQGSANLQSNKTVSPSSAQQIVLPDLINEIYTSIANGTTSTAPTSNEVFTVSKSPIDGKSYYFSGTFHGEDNTVISVDGTITASSGGCNFTNILTITGSSSVFYAYWSNGTIEFVTNAGHLTTDGDFNIYEAPIEYYDGLKQVTVNAAALQSKVVTPSTEQQIITPDNSLYGIIPQGTVSEEPYPGWPALSGVYPPSPISVGTHVEGLIDIIYNTNKLGTIEINGDITESHFESICTLTAAPAYQSTLQLGNAVWDSDGLNFYLSLGGLSLVAATDIRFDSLPVYNYYGLSQVIVEAVAATTSYYLAQDSQGYITYSSIMPSGGEYYIFDVAGIKHVEPAIEYKIFTQGNLVLDTAVTGAGDTYYIEDTPTAAVYSFSPKLNEGAHYRITRNNTEYTGVIAKTSSGDYTWAEIGNDFNNWDSSFPFGVRIYSLNPSSQYYLVYIGESTSGSYTYKIELEDSGV